MGPSGPFFIEVTKCPIRKLAPYRQIITIHSSPDESGSDAVFVGVNEYAYQIPRDKPFEVPSSVVEVLRNAVVTRMKPGPGGVVVERTMPRYAFSAVPA